MGCTFEYNHNQEGLNLTIKSGGQSLPGKKNKHGLVGDDITHLGPYNGPVEY